MPMPLAITCTDPERGGGQEGVWTPLKNHKNIVFLSNTDPDPLKITKLPTQLSMIGHDWHAILLMFQWLAEDGLHIVVF